MLDDLLGRLSEYENIWLSKGKGIFLGGGSETEILNDTTKSSDTCTKPGLFAQMAWI